MDLQKGKYFLSDSCYNDIAENTTNIHKTAAHYAKYAKTCSPNLSEYERHEIIQGACQKSQLKLFHCIYYAVIKLFFNFITPSDKIFALIIR